MSHIPASCDHFWGSYVVVKLENFGPIPWKSHFGRFVNVCECGILASKNLGFRRNHFFANVFSRKCFLCSWLLEKRVSAYENHFWSFYNTSKSGISDFFRILEDEEKSLDGIKFWDPRFRSIVKTSKMIFISRNFFF